MTGSRRLVILAVTLFVGCADPAPQHTFTVTSYPPAPAGLDLKLSTYLEAARAHPQHAWRDAEPLNADGTVNGYVEIPKGEFSIRCRVISRDR